ncbi:unnamed protein product [Rhizophagus irregularis]|nr:unnamed protein product [Rhizophagus irregularis]
MIIQTITTESIHPTDGYLVLFFRPVTIKNPMLGLLTRVTLDPMFYYNIFRRSGTIRRSGKISNFRKAWRCKYKFLSEYLS